MKTALVIGGNGQIGRATASALSKAGYDVTIAHRSAMTTSTAEGFRQTRLDRDDTDALLAASRGQDVVVDNVAYSTEHAAQLALLAGGVESLIVMSTGSVYLGANGYHFGNAIGDDQYPDFGVPLDETSPIIESEEQTYGPMKAAMERVLLAVPDLPVSILRPGAVHGPHSPKLREWYFIKRVLDRRQHVVLARDGLSQFSTSSTGNIAALVVACARQPGTRVLNAVDEEQYTLAERCGAILGVMNHTAELVTFSGPPRGLVGADPWDGACPFVCSMERARREVGYVPAMTYAESVQVDLDWLLPALERAGGHPDSWQQLFPSVVTRYGADGWFPYEAEDFFVEKELGRLRRGAQRSGG